MTPKIWPVGALCRAIADALDARFNPVAVRGEISGFTRASSGHCYFTLKDDSGQIRCAMFRRAASLLSRLPRDGDQVEALGRLGVYEARGELQLVVESLRPVGQGALFEEFLRLKQKLEAEGLFDAARKRPIAPMPRAIGVVTSLSAAAWHDVMTALQRRVPHIPVLLSPAQVQGAEAAPTLVKALKSLYLQPEVDVILLVRGGGARTDLATFDHELIARTIATLDVPVFTGIGHEIDTSVADVVANRSFKTPTACAGAIAELQREVIDLLEDTWLAIANCTQRLLEHEHTRLARHGRDVTSAVRSRLALEQHRLDTAAERSTRSGHSALRLASSRIDLLSARLAAVDPARALARGWTITRNGDGAVIRSIAEMDIGDTVITQLVDGILTSTVSATEPREER